MRGYLGLGSNEGDRLANLRAARETLSRSLRITASSSVLLMIVPGGLGELAYAARDRLLRAVARRRNLDVPSLARDADAFMMSVSTRSDRSR